MRDIHGRNGVQLTGEGKCYVLVGISYSYYKYIVGWLVIRRGKEAVRVRGIERKGTPYWLFSGWLCWQPTVPTPRPPSGWSLLRNFLFASRGPRYFTTSCATALCLAHARYPISVCSQQAFPVPCSLLPTLPYFNPNVLCALSEYFLEKYFWFTAITIKDNLTILSEAMENTTTKMS